LPFGADADFDFFGFFSPITLLFAAFFLAFGDFGYVGGEVGLIPSDFIT